MQRSVREHAARVLLLAMLMAGSLYVFRDYLFGEQIMVFADVGSDTLQAYLGQFTTVVNHIREGNLSFYDLNYGMGTNLMSLNLFDPGFLLTVGAGVLLGNAHMLIYLVVVHILKILAAGWFFYLFLSEHRLSIQAKLMASFAYAFSGYLMVWGQHYQFGTPVVYLAMLLLFTEKRLQGKKGGLLLAPAVFLNAIMSVYFSYMSLALVGVYTLLRTAMEGELTFRQRVGKVFSVYALILLGLAMGMAVFLPTAHVLMGVSSRLEGEESSQDLLAMLLRPDTREYYQTLGKRLFSSHLSNISPLTEGMEYTGYLNYYEDPVAFASAAAVFLGAQYLFGLWRMRVSLRVKIAGYLSAALLLTTVLLRAGSIILNGFVPYSYRYLYLCLPPLLLCAAWTWDRIREGFFPSIAGLVLPAILMVRVYGQGLIDVVFGEYRRNVILCFACGLMTAAAVCLTGIMAGRKRENLVRAFSLILAGAIMVSVLSDSSTAYTRRMTLRKLDDPEGYMISPETVDGFMTAASDAERDGLWLLAEPQSFLRKMYSQDIQDAFAYLKERDPDFYRIEKIFSSGTFSTDSMIQGYRSISTYNSIMNKNMKEFFAVCYPEFLVQNDLHILYRAMPGDGWAGAFLGIRYFLSEEPELDAYYFAPIAQFGKIFVHENIREAKMGHFFTRAYSEDSLEKLWTKGNRQVLLGRGIALEGAPELADVRELLDDPAARPRAEEAEELPPQGQVTIGNPEAGTVETKPVTKDSHIQGSYQAGEDGYILYMIPYEEGWTLTVDGQKKQLLKGDLGFLAWKAERGEHSFTLEFVPPGMHEGLLISLIGWLMYALYLLIEVKDKIRFASGSSLQKC